MLNKIEKYSYNDISVLPAVVSDISHRSECIIEDLPIFTAPMTSVVGLENYEEFEKNHIHSILPRTVDLDIRLSHPGWCAYSLSEFEKFYVTSAVCPINRKVLVDIANGHMRSLMDLIRECKRRWPLVEIMAGNIANPQTYLELSMAGADYVRLGIGSGNGCITSSNTAIHYPMASLINDTVLIRGNFTTKIIADGGVRGYSDVIKALALGADYVMIGGLLSSMIESSGQLFKEDGTPISREDALLLFNSGGKVFKKFYGMASREGQIDLKGQKTQTAEGVCKMIEVKYTLSKWVKNMSDYLRSAMSYTGARDLESFKRNTQTIVMGGNTYGTINK